MMMKNDASSNDLALVVLNKVALYKNIIRFELEE